jgi:hypothetical protein
VIGLERGHGCELASSTILILQAYILANKNASLRDQDVRTRLVVNVSDL